MAYWLEQTLVVLPLALWVYIGMGIFPALWLLPRRDWQQIPLVLCLSFALGSALLTIWMFVLGTLGAAQQISLLRFDLIFLGTVLLTLVFGGLAWRKYRREVVLEKRQNTEDRLAFDEKLLLAFITLALLLRGLTTAYWTFNAYDTLWVFGYQGRLFSLLGYIPQDIGYYPPFLSLQYAFMQLAVGGIDDHAARIVVWFLHVGSILAAYVAGAKLLNRRTGIILAALWTLYPHVGEWAHVGDLEIPLAFLFTLAAAFFLMAWDAPRHEPRRRYALLVGVIFGIAMWTKPTAGAFIWGVLLLVMADFGRVRGNWRAWYPRFETAFITGLACLPLGAVWYVRNMLFGHNAIDFPNPVWLTLARRSGDLLGFLLLFLVLLLVYITFRYGRQTRKNRFILAWLGLILILAGLLPSMPFITPNRMNPPNSYITVLEAVLTVGGIVILSTTLYRMRREIIFSHENVFNARFGWIFLLVLPYFATWFFSYSYHYRLLFAVVPLLLLPSAALLAGLLPEQRIQKWHVGVKVGYSVVLIVLALPGIGATILQVDRYFDWLWVNRYPDDAAKYESQNPELMLVVEQLQYFINDTQRPLVIMAPGEQRLPFFFPLATMTTHEVPTHLDALAGYTHFLYGTQAAWRYQDASIAPENNQIVAALGRSDVMKPILRHSDGTFGYDLYAVQMENQQQIPRDYLNPFPHAVIYGDFVQLEGFAFSNNQLAGTAIAYDLALRVLKTPDKNYRLRFEMVNVADNKVYGQWETCIAPSDFGCYEATLWAAGEVILTSGRIFQTETQTFSSGDYELRISFIALDNKGNGIAAPVTINGQSAPAYQMPGFRYN